MRTRTKAALTVLCALLLVVATFLGTLAYLTSKPDAVTNTFTVGNVTITLDEAKTDEYGVVVDEEADRVLGNELKLIPGHTYSKDPTVHVDKTSEPCWIFVKIDDGITSLQADTTVVDQITSEELGWTKLEDEDNVYYIDHDKIKAADYKVFETLTIKDNATFENFVKPEGAGDDWKAPELTVTAYAIQKDSLTTAAAAWAALNPPAQQD